MKISLLQEKCISIMYISYCCYFSNNSHNFRENSSFVRKQIYNFFYTLTYINILIIYVWYE